METIVKTKWAIDPTHSEIAFKSKSFDGELLTGDLTIRGITKEVTLDVGFNGIAIDPYGQTLFLT